MCGIGKYGYDLSRDIPLTLLHSLCEGILSHASLIRLNGLGESTIMPNFLECLELITNLKAQLEIVSNLTVQKPEIWDKLIENNTNFLISCDCANPQKYESIRRGAIFSGFLKNLEYIGKNISNPLQGQIIFTLMQINYNDLEDVIELAANNQLGGVIVNVVKSDNGEQSWLNEKHEEIVKIFHKAHSLAESLDVKLKLPDHLGNFQIKSNISNPSCESNCENPWNEVYIRYNGDLTACNMLNPYIYGNCKNYAFEKVWNGLNADMFRTFVNTKYRHYYCRECYYLV